MTKAERDSAFGAAGVCAVCALMSLWPLLGHPPYGFFSVMKLSLAGGSAFAAFTLWNLSPKFAPVCFLLVATGAVHLFGKMRRQEWVPFNWTAFAVFTLAAGIILYYLSRKEPHK